MGVGSTIKISTVVRTSSPDALCGLLNSSSHGKGEWLKLLDSPSQTVFAVPVSACTAICPPAQLPDDQREGADERHVHPSTSSSGISVCDDAEDNAQDCIYDGVEDNAEGGIWTPVSGGHMSTGTVRQMNGSPVLWANGDASSTKQEDDLWDD